MASPHSYQCPSCATLLFRINQKPSRFFLCPACERKYVLIQNENGIELREQVIDIAAAREAVKNTQIHQAYCQAHQQAEEAKDIALTVRARYSYWVVVFCAIAIAVFALLIPSTAIHPSVRLEYAGLRFVIMGILTIILFHENDRTETAERTFRMMSVRARQLYYRVSEEVLVLLTDLNAQR